MICSFRALHAAAATVLAAAFALGGCVADTIRPTEQRAAPRFDPVLFFAGRSEGKGILKIALHRRSAVHVASRGRVTDDGGIVLDQTVERAGKPATQRQWMLQPIGAGRYRGALSDARGQVDARVDGNRLMLRFAMPGGLHAEQRLYLRPGGMVAHNVLIVRKFGIAVARLDETITRLGR